MSFIPRNWNRTEKDDFKLNIEGRLSDTEEAIPQYSKEGILLGWKIQPKYG